MVLEVFLPLLRRGQNLELLHVCRPKGSEGHRRPSTPDNEEQQVSSRAVSGGLANVCGAARLLGLTVNWQLQRQ